MENDIKKKKYIMELTNCAYREKIFYRWLRLISEGISLIDFFRVNDLHNVVVYGYGRVGKLLCSEILKSEDIVLAAVIDADTKKRQDGIKFLSPDDIIPDHDILISTYTDTNYVRLVLDGKSNNIVGIDELLEGYSFD